MTEDELTSFLKTRVDLLAGYPEPELQRLVDGSREVTFEPNEAIIEFGEEGRFLGVLLDGEAEVSLADDSGARSRISLLKAGDVFGEMSVMTGDKTVADVIGVRRCRALLIPEQLLSTVLVSHSGALKRLAKIVSERSKTLAIDQQRRELSASAEKRSDDPHGFGLRTEEPMKLLIINCGSSSVKYKFFDTVDPGATVSGSVERVGTGRGMRLAVRLPAGEVVRELDPGGHREAFDAVIEVLISEDHGIIRHPSEITAVGHRVVHGGERFDSAVIIDEEVEAGIAALEPLAPLHNPVNLLGIREARRIFGAAYHVAVFDTCFHHTLPPYAYLYGLPYEYYEKGRIRRYGFHGSSHLYVALRAAEHLKMTFNELEIVSCHLGNGASLCAVDHGRSVDTTMGLTPAEGLIMGTRCGDVDPAVLIHLMRSEGMDAERLETVIQKESGLLGLSGISNDMREVEAAAQRGDHRALLAFKTFCYRVRKYIGAYSAAMGGLDAVAFTGGIGQGSAGVRSLACQGLAHMGIEIDETKNRSLDGFDATGCISTEGSPVKVLVVPTDEERMIARDVIGTLNRAHISKIISEQKKAPIPIGVSAHHVHLAQEHVEALYGAGRHLTPVGDLSQPGQFACREQVNLVGPKGRVERVRVLGPERRVTQVEIAMTEQFKLGIHPPIRESGDLEGTPGMTLEGPAGSVVLDKGVICALRHIHMTPEDALRFGLRDKYIVRVRVEGDRELVFGDVLVRVHPNYRLSMHLDTDEANAANITAGMTGYIDEIQSRGV